MGTCQKWTVGCFVMTTAVFLLCNILIYCNTNIEEAKIIGTHNIEISVSHEKPNDTQSASTAHDSVVETEEHEKPNDTESASTAYDLVAETEEQINRKYCGSSVCKFFFPVHIGEQESRARLQWPGLIIMAQQTNRILVLPNVGYARFGACNPFTFDYYYSIESMRQSSPNITFITQDVFLQWNQEMKAIKAKKFTTKFIKFGRSQDKNDLIEYARLDIDKHTTRCLRPFDHLEYETAMLELRVARKTNDELIINALQSVQADVILMHYTAYMFYYSHFQAAPLTYNERLIEYAKSAATLLYPYIAVHWRMETAKPEKLLKCSQNLVDYINRIKKKTGIANVYVATDYPIDGGRQHSGTFHKITKDHNRAANVLKSNVNFTTLERINSSLPLLDNSEFLPAHALKHKESGIPGILDKLILTYSTWFVSGPSECCRVSSSYTAQVLRGRTAIIDNPNNGEATTTNNVLLNAGDRWEQPTWPENIVD